MAHPDLVPNFFMNTGETAGNNVDDEGNGYVDDRTGWDFVPCWGGGLPGGGDNDPTGPDTQEGARNATMTAGATSAAGSNARRVTGSCPAGWSMPLRIQSPLIATYQHASPFGYARLAVHELITT